MTDAPGFARYRADDESDPYIAGPVLAAAVNTALAAEQPLLITGEAGTGKTTLADSIARQLGWGDVLRFVTRSEHHARDCLYTFDNLRRFYDAQVKDPRARHPDAYVRFEALGAAIASQEPRVVLIDEIDKAPRDFPNDLLGVLEGEAWGDPTANGAPREPGGMRFTVRETGSEYVASHRPFVLLTSNNERQLPDAFLRRCVFHHIEFPDTAQLGRIIRARFDRAKIESSMVNAVVKRFGQLREMPLEKRPGTGELLVWVRVLLRAGVNAAQVESSPWQHLYPGSLVKLEPDLRKLAETENGSPHGSPPVSRKFSPTSKTP